MHAQERRNTGTSSLALLFFLVGALGLNACSGGSSPAPASPPAVIEPPLDPLRPQPAVSGGDAASTFGVAPQDVGGDGGGDSGSGGGAGDGAPIKRARVVITDRTGRTAVGQTNDEGNYFVKFSSSFQAPIVTKIITPAGVVYTSASNEAPAAAKILRLNVNPFTDKIVSDALASTVKGTDKTFNGADIDAARLTSATADMLSSVRTALSFSGITTTAAFDPIKSVYAYNGTGVDAVLESIAHTRNPNTGATELRAKLAGVNVDADGAPRPTLVSSTTPLVTTQVATAANPALNFAKLNAWVTALNQCIASGGGANSTCYSALFTSNYMRNSRNFEEDFRNLFSETGGSSVVGSVARNPVVLAVRASPGSSVNDSTSVEITVRQPRTGPLAGNRATPVEYIKLIEFRRDDALSASPAVNWLAHGNQRPFDASTSTRYVRRVQNNPAMQADVLGQSPSRNESHLQFSLNTRRFDVATKAYVDAGIRAVRIKGPGLPVAGLVMTPSRVPGVATLAVHNKVGSIPLAATVSVSTGDSFGLNWSGLNGQALAQAWPSTSVQYADTPLASFAGLGAFASYTTEVFRVGSANPSVADSTFTMANVSEVAAPASRAGVAVHDLSPSSALVTAPAPAVTAPATSVKIRWINNPNAAPVSFARVGAENPTVDYGATVANAFVVDSQVTEVDIPTPLGLPELRLNNTLDRRQISIWNRPGRADFQNLLVWSNPTTVAGAENNPNIAIVANPEFTPDVTQTVSFSVTGTTTRLLSNGAVDPLVRYEWRVNGGPVLSSSAIFQASFPSAGVFDIIVTLYTAGGNGYSASRVFSVRPSVGPVFSSVGQPNSVSQVSISAAGLSSSSRVFLTSIHLIGGERVVNNEVLALRLVVPGVLISDQSLWEISIPHGNAETLRLAYLCATAVSDNTCQYIGDAYTNGTPAVLPRALLSIWTTPDPSAFPQQSTGTAVLRRNEPLRFSGTFFGDIDLNLHAIQVISDTGNPQPSNFRLLLGSQIQSTWKFGIFPFVEFPPFVTTTVPSILSGAFYLTVCNDRRGTCSNNIPASHRFTILP